jgi:demethylmenaquinone methyltransferase/2-methoxy-6-polyprenyl-1,4-benzoquinol methylase
MFDAIAGRYDLLNHLLSAGLDRRWRTHAIAALQLTGGETVLDLCTGTADLALAAASSSHPASRVVGLDFSAEMLRIGSEKVRGRHVDLIRGDATRIPLADGTVDAVTIGFGIRNVEHPREAFSEVVRVLRPQGKLVILEFSLPRSTILRSSYLWYFRRVLPLIGRAISKHQSAYTYLPESVEAFPQPEELSRQLRESGFGTVRAIPLTFGVVYMFVALKGGAAGPSAIID